MGSSTSKFTKGRSPSVPKAVINILEEYNGKMMSKERIYHWHKLFKEQFDGDEISMDELKKIFLAYFPDRDADAICAEFKRKYISDSEEVVNFLSFMKAFMMTRPLLAGIDILPFVMLDANCDGVINRKEARVLIERHYTLIPVDTEPRKIAYMYMEELYSDHRNDMMTRAQYISDRRDSRNYHHGEIHMALAAISNMLQFSIAFK
ncbi:S-modulin-like [Watersipora subatra]|uniref:S-modulin-like n=1 Tax=Watersipora subatra TaxID=2589382 RepID=UPI00355C343B